MEATVLAALRALRLRCGIFHVELWLTDRGVVLGEVHGRIGGDWIHVLLAHTLGTDVYGMVYDDALGRQVAAVPPPTGAAAVRFFAPAPGRVAAIEGFDEVAAHPAVVHTELTIDVGANIAPVGASHDRVGALVVTAATAGEATRLASALASRVRFVTATAAAPTTEPAASEAL
jgi:hypothetical protein